MRRGTPSATLFGNLLFDLRTANGQSMQQVAEIIGAFPSAVSQVEKGQRAVKEPKISLWAEALDVKEKDLETLWWLSQGWIPTGRGRVYYTSVANLRSRITVIMDRYTKQKTFTVPKIEVDKPVTRRRGKSFTTDGLWDLVNSLTGPQRERVRGYIEAIKEQ